MVMDLAAKVAVLVPNSSRSLDRAPCETAPPLMGIGSLRRPCDDTGEGQRHGAYLSAMTRHDIRPPNAFTVSILGMMIGARTHRA